MSKILISGLREMGVHGVLPEEQQHSQPFEIDLELSVDSDVAVGSDKIEDTVDYGAVIETVSRIVAEERYALLETLAARIAEVCKSDPRVAGVVVTVRKLRPPVRALVDHVGIRLEA